MLLLPPDAAVADTAAAEPTPPPAAPNLAVAPPPPAPAAPTAPAPTPPALTALPGSGASVSAADPTLPDVPPDGRVEAPSPTDGRSKPAVAAPTQADRLRRDQGRADQENAIRRNQLSTPFSSATSAPARASGPLSSAQSISARSAHPTTSASNGQADGRRGFPLSPIGAGLLGAGLVGIIDRMRRAQQRHRRAGEHIRLPHAPLSSLERRLRISDDPLAPYAVDAALRLFAAVAPGGSPVIVGVQVHPDEIELIPEDDVWAGVVPDPFEVRIAGASWFVARRLLCLREPNDSSGDRDSEAPCPALVTVGRSDVGPCLVNLEAMGSLVVSGDAMACEGLLRALAVELATSFWADQFELVLAGFGQELSRFERVRVLPNAHSLVDELRHRGRDGRSLLHTAGYRSFAEARMAAGSDTWDALVVLCSPSIDAGVASDLVDEVGDARTGLAVVTCGGQGGARHFLTLDEEGISSPLDVLGTVVWPQQVDSSELEGLGGLVMTAADLSSVPPWQEPYESITAPLPRVPTEGMGGSEERSSFDPPDLEGEVGAGTVEVEVAEAEAVTPVEVEVTVLAPWRSTAMLGSSREPGQRSSSSTWPCTQVVSPTKHGPQRSGRTG